MRLSKKLPVSERALHIFFVEVNSIWMYMVFPTSKRLKKRACTEHKTCDDNPGDSRTLAELSTF